MKVPYGHVWRLPEERVDIAKPNRFTGSVAFWCLFVAVISVGVLSVLHFGEF